MKIIYTLGFFLVLFIALFLNLGHFIDASQKPIKSDIIVSLGGGDGCRIKKTLSLYQDGYSTSKKFLYTGREIVTPSLPSRFSKSEYLLQNGVKKENIVFVKRGVIVNTVEELFFIKAYLKRHKYKSVLIISAPIHTRRIKVLASQIAGYNDVNIRYTVSSCEKSWWNPDRYYQDPIIRSSVFLEFKKLIYNLIKYSPPFIKYTSYAKKKNSDLWNDTLENF